ncbi:MULTISPECIES: hypothetical protein [unclassified Streptomyces]|uniref:hypothetical protein n=1 Tax=unclassified Streptomyces TaxID=2593676 RepID=UPI002253D6F0|nr:MULTISPECIES: hypothetical protein [unclassified Streptomyces]MCX4866883.1 hypothetical protein [Streptomyces sp. NBC_00906]MCX4898121.1 hypothetical protein [Streptomyces sp. NBC_00892]
MEPRDTHRAPRPPSRTRKGHDDSSVGPWHSVVLSDLRYGARSLTEAAAETWRPWRQSVRRRVDACCSPRRNRDRGASRASALAERRARQRLRARKGAIRRRVNTPAGELALEAMDAIDVPPPNHRHSELWLA